MIDPVHRGAIAAFAAYACRQCLTTLREAQLLREVLAGRGLAGMPSSTSSVSPLEAQKASWLLSSCPLTSVRRWRQMRLARPSLAAYANTVIGDLLGEVARLDERIKQYDARPHSHDG